MTKVFIDGGAGTTGLRLRSRLEARRDVELLQIDEALRKEPSEIKRIMALSEVTFLCLPDGAALEAAELASDTGTRVIDTSTAHRCSPEWAYGFPELSPEHRRSIEQAGYTAGPGCHASGFIALVYPLIAAGALPPEALLDCTSLTGYSGGGKKMIADYESPERGAEYDSPYLYSMGQTHKHLPEIQRQCGLVTPPVFLPIVGSFYSGMLVTVPMHKNQLCGDYTTAELRDVLRAHYAGSKIVTVSDKPAASLYAGSLSGKDSMVLYVSGNDDRIVLSALFDNLGKGASGAAIQCFNIMCGLEETQGLEL